jgi:hypothetical protein
MTLITIMSSSMTKPLSNITTILAFILYEICSMNLTFLARIIRNTPWTH